VTDWREHVRRRLPPLDISPAREIESVDELALQLEAAYDAALASGLDETAARQSAEREVPDWAAFARSVSALLNTRAARAHIRPPRAMRSRVVWGRPDGIKSNGASHSASALPLRPERRPATP
jgi:hypothetical protein